MFMVSVYKLFSKKSILTCLTLFDMTKTFTISFRKMLGNISDCIKTLLLQFMYQMAKGKGTNLFMLLIEIKFQVGNIRMKQVHLINK